MRQERVIKGKHFSFVFVLFTFDAKTWRPAYLTSQLNSVMDQPIPPKVLALEIM